MTDFKALGNAAFSAGKYQEADDFYAEALLDLQARQSSTAADFATLHANRAAALLKLNRPAAALEEADNAVNKNLKWSKAHYRKGEAFRALKRYREASTCFFEAARLDNNNATIKALAQTMRTQAAIEEEKPALQRLEEHVKETGSIANLPVTPVPSQFVNLVELGEGNYSQVFRAVFAPTKEVIALKVIDKKKAERLSMRHGNLRSELRAERRVLSKLNHPNIVKLYTAFQDATSIYYVEEYFSGRELWYRLKVIPPACLKKEWPVDSKLWGLRGLRGSETKFFMAQLVNALSYLRKQGIVHRDLKPENIMIQEKGEADVRYARLKLIDFGTCRDTFDAFDDDVADEDRKDDDVSRDDEAETLYKGQPLGKRRPRTHFVGTPEFMSPEAIHGRPADHRSDEWSFGCTFYQCLTGRTPFKGGSDYLTFLKADAAAYELPSYYDKDGVESQLLSKVLKVDPLERIPRIDDLQREPYFTGVDFDSLEKEEYTPRVPIPSLLEICIERLGEAIWTECESIGEGPLTRRSHRNIVSSAKADKKKIFDGEEERKAMNLSSISSVLDAGSKRALRRWLEQRSVMICPLAMSMLYGNANGGLQVIDRIENHSFLGYSQLEEGTYHDPYVVALLDNVREESDVELKRGVIARLNDSKPYPQLMFFCTRNPTDKCLSYLAQVRVEIPVIRVPSGDLSADNVSSSVFPPPTYLSLWLGGVLHLIVDSVRLESDEQQQLWLERELMLGKLCARYVVIVTNRRWFTKSFKDCQEALENDDADNLVPRSMRDKFLRMMQESGVQLIVRMGCEGGQKSAKVTIPKMEPTESTMSQVECQGFPESVRIVRMLPTDAVTDAYSPAELTGYFHLDTSEILSDEEKPSSTGRPYSSSSDE